MEPLFKPGTRQRLSPCRVADGFPDHAGEERDIKRLHTYVSPAAAPHHDPQYRRTLYSMHDANAPTY
ncbi:MAG: hypothetical protein P8Y47_11985 [Alphaproteobacteria bacterium]